jgi:hypothetical protein
MTEHTAPCVPQMERIGIYSETWTRASRAEDLMKDLQGQGAKWKVLHQDIVHEGISRGHVDH